MTSILVFALAISPYNDQGRIQVREYVQQQREAARNEPSPETIAIQNEFQRSMERRMLVRPSNWQEEEQLTLETFPAVGTTLTPTTTTVTHTTVQRPDLLQRLQAVQQQYDPRTLAFEESNVNDDDVEVVTTSPQFERFQLQDLSSENISNRTLVSSDEMNLGDMFNTAQEVVLSGDEMNAGEEVDQGVLSSGGSELTILDENAMNTDDLFGGEHISDADVLPSTQSPIQYDDGGAELTILDENDMYTDDLFGEVQIADADVLPYSQSPIQYDDGILNESEMILDDIFGERNIANISALPPNRIECIEVGRRVLQELIAAQQISTTPQQRSVTQQPMSSAHPQVTSTPHQMSSMRQQISPSLQHQRPLTFEDRMSTTPQQRSPTQQPMSSAQPRVTSIRYPISASLQHQRPLAFEEPSFFDLDDSSELTLLSDELQPSFRSNLEGTDSDLEDIIVPIPIPGRPGIVTYAPSERAEQIARLLEQADEVTKTVIASIGQTFKVGVLKKRYLRSKGLPDDSQCPTFDELYAQVDPDLLDPIVERSHRELEAHLFDLDDNHGAGLLAPLIGSPTQPKLEDYDHVQGYHDYMIEMEPYVADANARPMASSEGSTDEPYWSDNNRANQRISHYSTTESSEEYPDLLLDSVDSSPQQGQMVEREGRGYLDESYTYSGPSAIIPPPRPKTPVKYDPAPNQPDLWFETSPKQQRLKYNRKQGILDESLDKSGGPISLIPPPSQPLPLRRDPALLSSDEMLTDDIFGDDAIAQPERQHRPRTPTLNDSRHQFYKELAAGTHRREAYDPEIDEIYEPALVERYIMSSSSNTTSEEDFFDIQPDFVQSIEDYPTDSTDDRSMAAVEAAAHQQSELSSDGVTNSDNMFIADLYRTHGTSAQQTERSSDGVMNSDNMFIADLFGPHGTSAQLSEPSSDGIMNSDSMYTGDLFGTDGAEQSEPSSYGVLNSDDMFHGDLFGLDGGTPPLANSTQYQYRTPGLRQAYSFEDDGADVPNLISWRTPDPYQTPVSQQTDDIEDEILHSDDIEDDIAGLIGSNVPVSPAQRLESSYYEDEILHSADMQNDIFEAIGSNVAVPASCHRRTSITAEEILDDDEILNIDDLDDIFAEIGDNVVTSPLPQIGQVSLSSSDAPDNEMFAIRIPGFVGAFAYVSFDRIEAMTGVLAQASDEQKVSIITDAQDWLNYPNRLQNITYPHPEPCDKFRSELCRIFRLQINRELPPNIDNIPNWPQNLTSVMHENAFYALPVPNTSSDFVYSPKESIAKYFHEIIASDQHKLQQMVMLGKRYMSSSRAPRYIYYLREDIDQTELLHRLQRMIQQTDDADHQPDGSIHYAIPVPGFNGAIVYVQEEDVDEMRRFLNTATDTEKQLCIDENQKYVNGLNRPLHAVDLQYNEAHETEDPSPDDTFFAIPVPGYNEAFIYVVRSQFDRTVRFLAEATDDQKRSLISDAQRMMTRPGRPLNIIYPPRDIEVAERDVNYAPAISDHHELNVAVPAHREIPAQVIQRSPAVPYQSPQASQAVPYQSPYAIQPVPYQSPQASQALYQSPVGVHQFNRLLNNLNIEEEHRQPLDPTGESLAKSVEQSARYRALQEKYRRQRNLEPLDEEAPAFPALQQYNDPKTFETVDEFETIGSPVTANAPRQEDLEESLEKRVQYAIEAENRLLQSPEQHHYEIDDPFNRNINMSTIEADLYEEDIEDMLYENTPPKYKHRQHPGGQVALLDESIETTEVLVEPMVKGPAYFPERYDTDVLNESEMDVNDMFGDDAIAAPEPMHRPAPLGGGPRYISTTYDRDIAKEKMYSDMAAGRFRDKDINYGELDLVDEPEEFYDYDKVPEIRIVPPTPERLTMTPAGLQVHSRIATPHRLTMLESHQLDTSTHLQQFEPQISSPDLHSESQRRIPTPNRFVTPELPQYVLSPHFDESPQLDGTPYYHQPISEPYRIDAPNSYPTSEYQTPEYPISGLPSLRQTHSQPRGRNATPNQLATPEIQTPDGSPLRQPHFEPQGRTATPILLSTPELPPLEISPQQYEDPSPSTAANNEAIRQTVKIDALRQKMFERQNRAAATSPQRHQPHLEPQGRTVIPVRLETPERFLRERSPQQYVDQSPTTAANNEAIRQTHKINALRQKMLERQNRTEAVSQGAGSSSSPLHFSAFAQRRTPPPATADLREYDDDLNWQDGLYGDDFQQQPTERRYHDAYSPLNRRIYEEEEDEDFLDTSEPQYFADNLSTTTGEQEQSALDILDDDQMLTDDIFGDDVVSGM